MTTDPKSRTDKPGRHEEQREQDLDEALEETFPASDPIAVPADHDADAAKIRKTRERQMDEALEDTFPASDPVAPAQPGKK
ncbi:hypothetical protein [Bordetella genomosp. 13]|uniref:Uncharacterized protein n=1 Tax=Bordetella genomosp. 13 TaxID=463040 RepID=A0A1W6ZFG3_9BORD|nr:hypothetical protein [Bordetella genomosp. 13]ARP96116.1 hypothetical protein CAL15_18080 [Bordetella genomosp. 13]